MFRRPTVVVLLVVLVLTGCGGGSDPATPTPMPSPTAPATVSPGGTTVGDLVIAMDAAWAGVTSMRTTQWESEGGFTATPDPSARTTIESVILPSTRHLVTVVDGHVVDEQIVVDGHVFMKGATVPAMIAPAVDANTWIEVEPAAATANVPIAGLVSYLTTPITSPMGEVSADTRALEAFPGGSLVVAGRPCQVFTFGGGGNLDYQITIDEQGLPCSLTLSGGDRSTITIYEFNLPGLVISAPSVATPPAG